MFFIIFYRDDKPKTTSCFSYNEKKPSFHLYSSNNSIMNCGDSITTWKPYFNKGFPRRIVRPIWCFSYFYPKIQGCLFILEQNKINQSLSRKETPSICLILFCQIILLNQSFWRFKNVFSLLWIYYNFFPLFQCKK